MQHAHIRNEGIRILQSDGEPLAVDGFPGISKVAFVEDVPKAYPKGGGNPVTASGGSVRPTNRSWEEGNIH